MLTLRDKNKARLEGKMAELLGFGEANDADQRKDAPAWRSALVAVHHLRRRP